MDTLFHLVTPSSGQRLNASRRRARDVQGDTSTSRDLKLLRSILGDEGLISPEEVCTWQTMLRGVEEGGEVGGGGGVGGEGGAAGVVSLREVAERDMEFSGGVGAGWLQTLEGLVALIPPGSRGKPECRQVCALCSMWGEGGVVWVRSLGARFCRCMRAYTRA